MRHNYLLIIINLMTRIVDGKNSVMLLYRPIDSTYECAVSEHLRYDISFGMGMSDTVTLVFRNLIDSDYQCGVEIVSDEDIPEIFILIVIRYPKSLSESCSSNPTPFIVNKGNTNINPCRSVRRRDHESPYYFMTAQKKINFKFFSNSSIDREINAYHYEVTATSARKVSHRQSCHIINETICERYQVKYCFTSGAVCDGIKNCGIPGWFDESPAGCTADFDKLSVGSILVFALCLLGILFLCSYLIHKWIPQVTGPFFILNANDDNRIYLDSVVRPYRTRSRSSSGERQSFVQMESCHNSNESSTSTTSIESTRSSVMKIIKTIVDDVPNRKDTSLVKYVTDKLLDIQESIKAASGRFKSSDGEP